MDDSTPTDERKAVIAALLFDWTLERTKRKADLGDEQIESLQSALTDLPGESLEDYRRFWRWAQSAEPDSVDDATVAAALDFVSERMPAELNIPLGPNEEFGLSERAKAGIGFEVAYHLWARAIDRLHYREAATAWGRDKGLASVGPGARQADYLRREPRGGLIDAQRRVQQRYRDIARDEREERNDEAFIACHVGEAYNAKHGQGVSVGAGTGTAVKGNQRDRTTRVGYPIGRDDHGHSPSGAQGWLQQNDPQITADEVAAQVQAALEANGLVGSVHSAFPRHKPNAEQKAQRTRVRAALQMIWDDGRNREHLAAALGVATRTVERLMSEGADTHKRSGVPDPTYEVRSRQMDAEEVREQRAATARRRREVEERPRWALEQEREARDHT
jgi:hypothetical protein